MGWNTANKGANETAKEFIEREALSWDSDCKHKYTILDSAIVGFGTYYAAVERIDGDTGARTVWAAVILLEFNPGDGYNFGWKTMDESCGPNAADCPERILNLLTPLGENAGYAADWRARCRENIAKRKAVGELGAGHKLTIYGKQYVLTSKHGRSWHAMSLHDGRTYKLTPATMAKATEIEAPAGAVPKVEQTAEQSDLF